MKSYETKFYKILNEIGLELKKKFLKVPELTGVELSMRDIQILEYLGTDFKTMSEIAELLDISAGTLTPIIDSLVKRKILKRERNEKIDRRKIFISTDITGKSIFKEIVKIQKIAVISMLKDLTDGEKEKTYQLMEKMCNVLKNN